MCEQKRRCCPKKLGSKADSDCSNATQFQLLQQLRIRYLRAASCTRLKILLGIFPLQKHTTKGKVLWLPFRWFCTISPTTEREQKGHHSSWILARRKSVAPALALGMCNSEHDIKLLCSFPLCLHNLGFPLLHVWGSQLCLEGSRKEKYWQWGWGWCLQCGCPSGFMQSSPKDIPWRMHVIFFICFSRKMRKQPKWMTSCSTEARLSAWLVKTDVQQARLPIWNLSLWKTKSVKNEGEFR